MAKRLWLGTDSNGRCHAYTCPPSQDADGDFICDGGDFSEAVFDDKRDVPPPGEVWEYVRTDCVDTESGALAAAKAEIERLKAELAEAMLLPACVRELLACADDPNKPWSDVEPHIEAIRYYYDPPIPINETLAEAKDGIAKLASELVEAKRMPECVRELVACIDIGGGSWSDLEKHTAAVRRHYAQSITISIGEWKLSDGTKCRVWSDGPTFLARVDGEKGFHEIEPCGQIRDRKVWLVERTGE